MPEGDPAKQSVSHRDEMTNRHESVSLRILFVGRRKTGEPLRAHLNAALDDSDKDSMEFVLATNQRDALREIRSNPPKVVLVEVDSRPDSRSRFGEMVRYRLPSAQILAVGKNAPQGSFSFDGFIPVPTDPGFVHPLYQELREKSVSYILENGVIRLNLAKRTVHSPNGRHHMTPKQCALLRMLMVSAGKTVQRRDIMSAIWDTSYLEDTRTLDVHIRWLRECIEPDPSNPQYLITIRGQGYMLQTDPGLEINNTPTSAH